MPPDPHRYRRPIDEPPSLGERLGCFLFVALPLVFGLPVARAWATVLGAWFLVAYALAAGLLLAFIVYLLERDES